MSNPKDAGAAPGRAALVLIDLQNPDARSGVMNTIFVEGEHACVNPIASCWALWESTKNHWPNHRAAVIADERAKHLWHTGLLGAENQEMEIT
jgi:hypothetical protein